jgi:hypothetical protein
VQFIILSEKHIRPTKCIRLNPGKVLASRQEPQCLHFKSVLLHSKVKPEFLTKMESGKMFEAETFFPSNLYPSEYVNVGIQTVEKHHE